MRTRSAFAANGGGHKLAGQKRPAAESLNDDQRFTKRFNLLSIDSAARNGNSNLYIPVNNPAAAQNGPPLPPRDAERSGGQSDELMQVDDTRDRVYIHDLDEELADIESEEERLIFLPDIEQRLSQLPRQVLLGTREEPENQELVLYSAPKSLTVDEGHDVVRKAIIEARQRAQEKAVEEAKARQEDMNRKYDHGGEGGLAEVAHGYSAAGYQGEDEEPDPDAMDIG
ncbi:hypothetical protein B0A55_00960 [Friedmanniomyces simplex]|uniref:Uncharacterized protein n=1 Tax=Friedmanniomyces simplex TaxID=329884 RepID=A0A4U0Y343_9PEZI|nr:hypothetical protein B0A55_00960 [Friedmanniomyces simplex]